MHNSKALTVLGFDFGMRKIGTAVGQTISATATPLKIIPAQDGIPNWTSLETLINEWQPHALIVGIPYNMDGSEQEITFAARKFSRRLGAKFKLQVHLVDERLTTKMAELELSQQNKTPQQVDSHAAALILESWLRENHHDS